MISLLLFVLCAFSPSHPPSLLHQLTTGAIPFDGVSRAQIEGRILHAPAPPVGSGFSSALKMVIARMLEKVFVCLWGVMFFCF
jgi:hypothetical protein